jgi:hypothetical protein
MPLPIASTNEQQVPVTASPVTATGRPASVDGPLRVTVVSGAGTVLQDPATPLVFRAVSGDVPGTTEYLVEADADLGAGVVTIQDTVTYEVSGAQAASFGLVAGPAEPKVAGARARARR